MFVDFDFYDDLTPEKEEQYKIAFTNWYGAFCNEFGFKPDDVIVSTDDGNITFSDYHDLCQKEFGILVSSYKNLSLLTAKTPAEILDVLNYVVLTDIKCGFFDYKLGPAPSLNSSVVD